MNLAATVPQPMGLPAMGLDGVEQLMGQVASERNADRITRLVAPVCATLTSIRDRAKNRWSEIIPDIRAMRGFNEFHNDPFTRHAYVKPRGYAGDAGLIDHIYRPDTIALDEAGMAGRAIFRYTAAGPAPRAVTNRRALLARKIDAMAITSSQPLRIASLACGHLREAELIASLETGLIGSYFAIDQDPRSVAEVERSFSGTPIEPMTGSVKDIIRGSLAHVADLDFFYAAGLFDYLDLRVAQRLVKKMFDRLKPGGSLWVANFVPNIPDRAYMEAVMDWWLIYRTPDEMATLDAEVNPAQIAHKHVFLEGEQNIAFLELRKG